MNELIYPPENEIGQMFIMFHYMPYIVFRIKVNEKEYTGTVNSIKIGDLRGTIISGEFHPHLQTDFFEAFEIFPNQFELVRAIDLKAPIENTSLNQIFLSVAILEKCITANILNLRGNIYTAVKEIKRCFEEFQTFHPEINLERSLNLINECIDKISFLTVEMSVKQEEMETVMKYIVDTMKDAMRAFIISPKY